VLGESHQTGRHHDSVRVTTDTKGKQVNIPALFHCITDRKVLCFRSGVKTCGRDCKVKSQPEIDRGGPRRVLFSLYQLLAIARMNSVGLSAG